MSGIVCDKRMPFTLKAAVYKTVIRHVLVYVIEISALRKAEQNFLERREMRMFRWMIVIVIVIVIFILQQHENIYKHN